MLVWGGSSMEKERKKGIKGMCKQVAGPYCSLSCLLIKLCFSG